MDIFKAWDKNKKEWVKHFSINPEGSVFTDELSDERNPDIILSRYAGSNDKNGNRVFGKDIIKVEICGVPSGKDPEEKFLREIIGEVGIKNIAEREEFYNGLWKVEDYGFAFVLKSLEDKKIGKNIFDAQTVLGYLGKLSEIEIEIIGNEFENPELLNKKS